MFVLTILIPDGSALVKYVFKYDDSPITMYICNIIVYSYARETFVFSAVKFTMRLFNATVFTFLHENKVWRLARNVLTNGKTQSNFYSRNSSIRINSCRRLTVEIPRNASCRDSRVVCDEYRSHVSVQRKCNLKTRSSDTGCRFNKTCFPWKPR